MSAVWDKFFGSTPVPANDAPVAKLQSPLSRDVPDAPAREMMLPNREAEPEPTMDASAQSVASTFDSIGRRNETLRAQLDAIEFAFSNIEIIRSHFLGVLSPIDEILREIERTKTKHHDAESKLEALVIVHDKLKLAHAELTVERNNFAQKQSDFVSRIQDLEAAIQKSMGELNEARAGLATHSARADRLERELEDSKRRLAAVVDQLPSLRTEFVAKEKKLQEVEQQRASLEDRQKLAAQEIRSSRSRIEEMVASASKLNRQINELEGRYADAIRRIAELEAALSQETSAHARLKTAHLDDQESHRLTISNLREEINALNVRSEGAERLLTDARAELRERNAAIRGLEQTALENALAIQTREQTQTELEQTLATAHAKQSETEEARAALEARAGDLSHELDNRTTALKRAEEQISSLEARMAAEVKLAISELETRDATIVKLRADLETQSAARAFAEGALQSARQDRVSWRTAQDSANEANREKLNKMRA